MSFDRSTLLALGLGLLVGIMALTAWGVSLFADGDAFAITARATPTKTPGVVALSATTGSTDAFSGAPLPTLTPTPTPAPPSGAPAPAPSADKEAPQDERLLRSRAIAAEYGLNPAGDYIIVDQDAQEMIIVSGGDLMRVLPVTTGDPAQGWETPAWFGLVGEYWGAFQGAGGVMADDGWWLFQRGGNFLIHGLPYELDAAGEKQYFGWHDLGAAPASHGCIRLSPEDARWFSQWNPEGRPIIILPFSDRH